MQTLVCHLRANTLNLASSSLVWLFLCSLCKIANLRLLLLFFLGRGHRIVFKVYKCKHKLTGVQSNITYNVIMFIY